MRHITLTGYYAGTPICGAARNTDGDRYAHPGEWLDNPAALTDLCPICRKVWDDIGEDLNDETD